MQETVTIEHSVEQKLNRSSCESVCRLIVIVLEDPALCIDFEIGLQAVSEVSFGVSAPISTP